MDTYSMYQGRTVTEIVTRQAGILRRHAGRREATAVAWRISPSA